MYIIFHYKYMMLIHSAFDGYIRELENCCNEIVTIYNSN